MRCRRDAKRTDAALDVVARAAGGVAGEGARRRAGGVRDRGGTVRVQDGSTEGTGGGGGAGRGVRRAGRRSQRATEREKTLDYRCSDM